MSLKSLTAGVALATAVSLTGSTLAEALPVNSTLGVQAAPAPVQTENVRWVCGPYRCFWRPGWGYGWGGYGWRRGWGGYGWRGGWRGYGWRGGWRRGWRRW